MSTNTKKKHGTGAAVVLIVLCLLALGTLGYIIWRQFNPMVPETAEGYVAAAGTTAPVYDENGTQLGSLVRGSAVQYVAEDAEGGADRIRVVNGEGYAYLDAANLTADYNGAVLTETVYALRGMSLTDETGAVPGCAVEKGMALTVTGFDGLDENGEVLRWAVSCDRGEGYIDNANVRLTAEEALAQYDDALYQRHAARGDAWGGGLTFGYAFFLSPHWNIECYGSVGAVYYDHKHYYRDDHYSENRRTAHGYAFIPFKLGVSFAYIIK